MAEQAAGAVSSLLSIIRSEAQLLSGVGDDMRSIKEEMESMNSFLDYLARTVPPDREHDEQVRTWMNQVRHLALDCNSCLDLYLYRTNPEVLGARGCFGRYLCWLPWFFRGMVAQHSVANQLRQLKDRAREVSERRCRYSVEVPAARLLAAGQESLPGAGAGLHAAMTSLVATSGGDDDEDWDEVVETTSTRFEPRFLEDYLNMKLADWINRQVETRNTGSSVPSVAVVAADDMEDTSIIAREVSAVAAIHFKLSVLVHIPAVHSDDQPLQSEDILFYILRGLEHAMPRSRQQGTGDGEIIMITEEEREEDHVGRQAIRRREEYIYREKMEVVHKMEAYVKRRELIDYIVGGIIECIIYQLQRLQFELELEQILNELEYQDDLTVLLLLLYMSAAAAAEQGHAHKKFMPRLAGWYQEIINITARKLKDRIEKGEEEEEEAPLIRLHEAQYAHILQEVFPRISSSKPLQDQDTNNQARSSTNSTSITSVGEDQIRKIVHKVLKEMQEDKSAKQLPTPSDPIVSATTEKNEEIPETTTEQQIMKKIEEVKRKTKEQLNIKDIFVHKIQNHLHNKSTLIILKVDPNCISRWEETRKALSMLGRDMRAVIVTTANTTQWAEEYCYPPQKPIDCSRVGLYHDTVLQHTRQHKNNDIYCSPQIIRDILVQCEPHEFCMKIFAHAMYSKPKRSNDELRELLNTLMAVSPKSLGNTAKKMLQYSFSDLSKEYKSCLLYLAIFPQGYIIRRSTLIGRWVAEGLITREDWPTPVHLAERCFEALVDRWLVYPASIDATGKVKSCKVGELVHKFISKIARKQGILHTHLPDHLAQHFSIFNDIQLRRSDMIQHFLKKLSRSPQMSLLKLLDLEGCQSCFRGRVGRRYLKAICTKLLLLKYLSLRKTDVTRLPAAINNLRELEVLDIRQTMVLPETATRNVRLLKLRRLLAGYYVNPSLSNTHTGTSVRAKGFMTSVEVPEKIGNMEQMEVLYNVKLRNSQDLSDIGKLWQLRKLGIVVEDKNSHLRNLLRAISELHACLLSLSITFHTTGYEGTPSSEELPASLLRYPPKLLESLSVSGTTQKVRLLPLLAKDHHHQLAKVTLSSTSLNQEDLKVLAKLKVLLCLKLENIGCTESVLTFKKNEFQKLNYFLLQRSSLTEIMFEEGATPELKKIILSLTNIERVSGVEGLPKLEELEFSNNTSSSLLSSIDNAKQITKLTLCGTLLEQANLRILAKKPNVRSLELLDTSCCGSQLTFNENEFQKLNTLIVNCSDITEINFTTRSALSLQKIVWTFTNMQSLSGINNLPKLKELKFNGAPVPFEVEEAINKLKERPGFDFKHNKSKNQEQEKGDETAEDEDDDARFPFCWKKKV